MAVCGSQHPSQPLACTKSTPCYGWHCEDDTQETWPGNPLPPKPCKKGSRSAKLELLEIVDRMETGFEGPAHRG